MDRIEIANECGRAVVSPAAGASLRSLRARVGDREYELLAGGRDEPFDPRILPSGSGSFLMAPWVNRIRDGRLVAADGVHILPLNHGAHAIHGTVRQRRWEVEEVAASFAILRTALADPWPYRGLVRYHIELGGASLRQRLEVHAAENEREFPAGVGWHPWFARSLGTGEGTVRADVEAQWELDASMTPTGACAPTALSRKLRAGGHFAPGEVDGCFRLSAGAAITARWPELVLSIRNSSAVTHVMLYSPQHAICIEPQTSTVDAFQLTARGVAETGSRSVVPGRPLIAWTEWSWAGNGAP